MILSAPNYLGIKIIIPNRHVTCKQKGAFKSHYHKLRRASGRGSLSSIDKNIHPITVFLNVIQNWFKVFMRSIYRFLFAIFTNNLLIFIYLDCVRRLSWSATYVATLNLDASERNLSETNCDFNKTLTQLWHFDMELFSFI